MNIVIEFLESKEGKKLMKIGVILLVALTAVKFLTPKVMNVFINNGNDCQLETLTNKNIKEYGEK